MMLLWFTSGLFLQSVWVAGLRGGLLLLIETPRACAEVHRMLLKSYSKPYAKIVIIYIIVCIIYVTKNN